MKPYTINSIFCLILLSSIIWTYVESRSCRIRTHIVNNAKVTLKDTDVIEKNADGFNLLKTFNWTVDGLKNSEYDGFLVRLQESTIYGDFVPITETYQECQASLSHLWIRTSNESLCDLFGNNSESECSFMSSSTTGNDSYHCAVDKHSDAAFDGLQYECTGSTYMMATKYSRTGKYYSLPNNRRSIVYHTEFNKNYQFTIYAYKRQFIGLAIRKAFGANRKCVENLASSLNIDTMDAIKKCCESNITSMAPLDLQFSEYILDKSSQTLNVTVSWIPPTPDKTLVDVFRLIRFSQRPVEDYNPQMTEYVTEGDIEGDGPCPRDSRRQVATIFNLLPNKEYFVMVAAYFSGENGRLCPRGSCSSSKNFIPEFNPCDGKWTKCAPGMKCIIVEVVDEVVVPDTMCVPKESSGYGATAAVFTQMLPKLVIPQESVEKESTSETKRVGNVTDQSEAIVNTTNNPIHLKKLEKYLQGKICHQNPNYCDDKAVCFSDEVLDVMSCSCSAGLVGDGISKLHNGSGCLGCPIINDCHFMATCVLLEDPSEGFICQCNEHYYGDGRKNGTGCRSWPKRTATIVVPVVLLGLIVFAIILWCLCFSGSKKNRSNNVAL